MTEELDRMGPDEAQKALDAIKEAERAGLSRAIPPRWFGFTIALITGALVAAAAAGTTELIAVFLAALVGAMEALRRKMGALQKSIPTKATSILALIGLVAFALAIIAGARVLMELYDITWAPLAGGAIMATIVYILSLLERREYITQIDAAQDQDQNQDQGQ